MGSVYPRQNAAATDKALALELQNILNSELGGKADDYGYIETTEIPRRDQTPEITENLTLRFNPSERSVNRGKAIAKLKALGLSDLEVEAIT